MTALATTAAVRPLRVAYVMSRFPKLTETFILTEILAMEEQGIAVEIFPLLRAHEAVAHPEAAALVRRAHFQPFVSGPIVAANLRALWRQPRAYLGVLVEVLRGTFPSPNFFVGALGILPKAVRFAEEMRRRGVEHVHAHFATHPAVCALVVHRLTGIPYSFTAHGSDLHVRRRMLDRKVDAAAFVVTISRFNADVVAAECGEPARDKLHVVHCGIDPQLFAPRPRRTEARPLQILCVASYEEVKGHRHLIEACRLLHARDVAFDCHLIGDGPLRAAVRRQIDASGLQARVHMHGPMARTEVARRLAAADVFALASTPTAGGKREGIPVVLMEAMAAELPVVASRLSGIPELVDDGRSGVLVEPGDVAALAAALERLAGDPRAAARMGRAGRVKVQAEFDLRRNAVTLAELFQRSR
jgi:glycosyltransferase involved in cell wall biosynthesis